jgi:hypothetical protein
VNASVWSFCCASNKNAFDRIKIRSHQNEHLLKKVTSAMVTREEMKGWVLEALEASGGVGYPKDVAKFIWDKYEPDLRRSGGLLYTWQYDVRWAAQSLRNSGILKAVDGRRDLPWELATT